MAADHTVFWPCSILTHMDKVMPCTPQGSVLLLISTHWTQTQWEVIMAPLTSNMLMILSSTCTYFRISAFK